MDTEKIKRIFNDIAFRYEIANAVLSFGTDRLWRKKLIDIANPQPNQNILDICCGTGDIAIQFAKTNYPLKITAIDFSEAMIDIAKKKHTAKYPQIIWKNEDIITTKLPDNSFDIVSCSFGIRNIPNTEQALDKIYRLCSPNGKAVFLEFSLPESGLLRAVYSIYLNFILPLLGGIISGHFKHYKYLSESINKWTKQIHFTNELAKCGFVKINHYRLLGGIVKIFTASKG